MHIQGGGEAYIFNAEWSFMSSGRSHSAEITVDISGGIRTPLRYVVALIDEGVAVESTTTRSSSTLEVDGVEKFEGSWQDPITSVSAPREARP